MKIPVLISCQIPECAAEVSYPLGMMKMVNSKPICQECFDFILTPPSAVHWDELPDISLEDLYFGTRVKPIGDSDL